MNIQERLTAFAMLGAEWVMWLLVILSIVGLAVILERALFFFKTRDDVTGLQDRLRALLKKGDIAAAKKMFADSPSVEAEVLHAAMNNVEDGAAAVEEGLDSASTMAKLKMERWLAFLGTMGSNAPFIGLLGTVIGIIRSFQALNDSAGQVTTGLMSEIGEALVVTAIGLLVALPAISFFNYFQRVIKSRLARANAMGHDLLAYVKADSTPEAAE